MTALVGSGTNVGLVVVGVLLAVVLWYVLGPVTAGTGGETAGATAGLDAFDLGLSEIVAAHVATRPFAASRLLLQEIMDATEPVTDPQGAVNTLRWDVPGVFNGCPGTWELVVNRAEKVVYQFDFIG